MPPNPSILSPQPCGNKDDGVLSIDGVKYNISNLISPKSGVVEKLPTPAATPTKPPPTKPPPKDLDNATNNLKPAAKTPPPRTILKNGSFRGADIKSPREIHTEALLQMISTSSPDLSDDRPAKELQKKPPPLRTISKADSFRFREAQKRLHRTVNNAVSTSNEEAATKDDKSESPSKKNPKQPSRLPSIGDYPIERTRRQGHPPPRARSADTPPNISWFDQDVGEDTSSCSRNSTPMKSESFHAVHPDRPPTRRAQPTRSNSTSTLIQHSHMEFEGHIPTPRERPPSRSSRPTRSNSTSTFVRPAQTDFQSYSPASAPRERPPARSGRPTRSNSTSTLVRHAQRDFESHSPARERPPAPSGRPTRSNSTSSCRHPSEMEFASNSPAVSSAPPRTRWKPRPPPIGRRSDQSRLSPPRLPPSDSSYNGGDGHHRRSNSASSLPMPRFPRYDDSGPALRRDNSIRTIDNRRRDVSPTVASPRSRVQIGDHPFSSSPRKSNSCMGRYNNAMPPPGPPLVDGHSRNRRRTRSNSCSGRHRHGAPPLPPGDPFEPTSSRSPSGDGRSPYISTRKVSTSEVDQADCRSSYLTPAPMIEIESGVFEPLRGSKETLSAVKAGEITSVDCMCCQSRFHCIKAARYVICPGCRVISPVPGGNVGVGLGFYHQDIPFGGKPMRRGSDRSTGQKGSPIGPNRCIPDEQLVYGGAGLPRDVNFAPSRARLDTA